MSRMIDADAYLDSIKPRGISDELWKECKEYKSITAFPAIEIEPYAIAIEPQWISCNERLPENNNTVLITHRGGVSVGWYNGRYWERGASTKHRSIKTVTAWMPLPPSYKGEDNE